jgi:putative transposase
VPFFTKELRLSRADYIGGRTYFITICTENRAQFFGQQHTGIWLLKELFNTAALFDFVLHAYCVMPDHLHFVSEGRKDICDLVKFVERFKQRTAYEFKRKAEKRLWQRRYYDHVLRRSDAVEDVACYIWWNPVRKGLCMNPREYPLSGSQTLDWMNQSASPSNWLPPWRTAHSNAARV